MTSLESYSLSDRYTHDEGRVFLTGVQALARLPIAQLRVDRAAGLNTAAFLSGYQGSPLGGFDQEVIRAIEHLPDLPILARPAVNEELGATAVMGTQLASTQPDAKYEGVVGFWYGKAPGLDRAGDALRHANFAGASRYGGAVALVGDDPANKSSTLPSSSDLSLIDLKMPIFYPGDVQEVLDLGRHAVELSRLSGLWTSMKIVTAVADGSGTADLSLDQVKPIRPNLEVGGVLHTTVVSGSLIAPYTNDIEREMSEVRLEIARRYGVVNDLNRPTANPRNGWIGIVAAGYTYREVLEALRRLGLRSNEAIEAAGIRLLRLQMPFPLDRRVVRNFARRLDEVVIVEEKNTAIEWMIKDALYGSEANPVVVGRIDEAGKPLIPAHGFLTADELVPALHRRLVGKLGDRLAPLPAPRREKQLIPLTTERSPYFCSGCPHNWGTKSSDGALIGAGIGCSGMALLMDEERVGDVVGITCMGTEGSQWIGMEPFLERDHFVQNLGDGTLFHSGQLAIQAAIAAGSNMTYKLLYNGTVAMTGGQTPTGGLGVRELARILLTQGVTEVLVTTDDLGRYEDAGLPSSKHAGKPKVWNRTRIVEAQDYLATVPGVTVLIHDQGCAAEARRERKRRKPQAPPPRLVINQRICEACGDCGEVSNCLSIQTMDTPFGPKTAIDQTSCNLDYSCLEGDCPSFMEVQPVDAPATEPGEGRPVDRRPRSDDSQSPEDPDDRDGPGGTFPDPVLCVPTDRLNLRLAGIGGTGVVTAAQIVATAAMLDGWTVRGLDQTGLSQKAGPVVSDLRLTLGEPAESNLIGWAEADAVIAFDLLVAGSDRVLQVGSPDRTVLVSSTTETPTGEMIGDHGARYPTLDELKQRVATATAADRNRFVDAGAIVRRAYGDGATSNVFMLGVAVQGGTLPIAPTALELAIELNGVAVGPNLAAFRLGRRWVIEPEAVGAADPPAVEPVNGSIDPEADLPDGLAKQLVDLRLESDLLDLLAMLTADLMHYQNASYAERFIDFLTRTVGAERLVAPDSTVLSEAVGRGLHKLMAYKDEYEVARLLVSPEALAAAEAVGGQGARVTWKLHPPMLRALGLSRKMSIDARRGRPVMALLARSKWLRGSVFDPFGGGKLRRAERSLPGEYTGAMDGALQSLDRANLEATVDLAASAMAVRGYERLKMKRIAEFRARLDQGVMVAAP